MHRQRRETDRANRSVGGRVRESSFREILIRPGGGGVGDNLIGPTASPYLYTVRQEM